MPATPSPLPLSLGANYDPSALPRDEHGHVFNEPWEAQAFALAVCLSDAACFSWTEWTASLGQEIQAAMREEESGRRGEGEKDSPSSSPSLPLSHSPPPVSRSSYYLHWLSALEQLCVKKGLVSGTDLHRRKEEWRQSYLHTAHGQPIELLAADKKAVPAG